MVGNKNKINHPLPDHGNGRKRIEAWIICSAAIISTCSWRTWASSVLRSKAAAGTRLLRGTLGVTPKSHIPGVFSFCLNEPLDLHMQQSGDEICKKEERLWSPVGSSGSSWRKVRIERCGFARVFQVRHAWELKIANTQKFPARSLNTKQL